MDEVEISPIEAVDIQTEGKQNRVDPKEFHSFVSALVEDGTVEAGTHALDETITGLCALIDDLDGKDNDLRADDEPLITARIIIRVDELLQKVAASSAEVHPNILNRIYNLSQDTDRIKRHAGMLFLNAINKIDKRKEVPLHLEEKIYQRIEYALHHTEEITGEELGMLLRFVDTIPTRLATMCYEALGSAMTDESIAAIFGAWSNKVGLPYARTLLRTFARSHDWEQTTLANIERVLKMNEGSYYFKTLPELYKNAHFGKEYKPNAELQEFEDNLLNITFVESQKVLDVGCGDGRLMQSLKKSGRYVVGIDIVNEHLAKAKAAGEDVVKASWHETPFADQSFDGIYCLGRSFLHNVTEIDAFRMLLEMNRIMKAGSTLLIDLPNPHKGDYAHERERMSQRSTDLKIWNTEQGFINDGPDPTHRFDRNVPIEDRFKTIAGACGFKVSKIARHEYEGRHGTNENIYWSLTKTDSLHPFMMGLVKEMNDRSKGVH